MKTKDREANIILGKEVFKSKVFKGKANDDFWEMLGRKWLDNEINEVCSSVYLERPFTFRCEYNERLYKNLNNECL